MAQLAKLLEAVFPGRIAIPASAVNSEVSVELKNTSLEEMARSLDLLVLPAESAASAGLEAE